MCNLNISCFQLFWSIVFVLFCWELGCKNLTVIYISHENCIIYCFVGYLKELNLFMVLKVQFEHFQI